MQKVAGGFFLFVLFLATQSIADEASHIKATCVQMSDQKTTFDVASDKFTTLTLIDRNTGSYILFAKLTPANPGKYPPYIKFDLIKQVKETQAFDPDTLPVGLWQNYAVQVWLYFKSDDAMVTVNTPSGLGTLWSADCKLGVIN